MTDAPGLLAINFGVIPNPECFRDEGPHSRSADILVMSVINQPG
jgi:hypothetical protein